MNKSARPSFSSAYRNSAAVLPWMLCAATLVASGAAHAGGALPTNGQYVAGQGSIASSAGNVTVNQSSSHGIINWQGFSIGQGNSVLFNNGSGATLNRVTGGQLSQIDGSLTATGSIYLINPQGIVIGPSGQVIANGSFVASTRDVSNTAFMSGSAFSASGTSNGSIVNQGVITSNTGDAILVGQSVTNTGSIFAPNGTVGLAAGNEITLQPAGTDARIAISGGAGSVTNSGNLSAAQAELNAAGGNVYTIVENSGGAISATGTTNVGGHVWLTAGGTGTVTIAGNVTSQNTNGSGGSVTVRGANIALPGSIDASASTANGQGGNVSVVATNNTSVTGTIRARGGVYGRGGAIETSGHTLSFAGANIDAGNGGSWLLDPYDLTVDATNASTINGALNLGTSVTLTTTATSASGSTNVNPNGVGDINIQSAIGWNTGATLTLDAYHAINVSAPIEVQANGNVVLNTNYNNAGGTGAVIFDAGDSLSYTGGASAGASLTINGAPYTLIYSMGQLQAMNNNIAGTYALATSLNTETDPTPPFLWTPIGASFAGAFTGTFTGLGNTISNMIRTGGSGGYAGLFGVNRGTITNINITGGYAGAGDSGILAGLNIGTISYSFATGTFSTAGTQPVGLLVGENTGTIEYSSSAGSISGAHGGSGGLVGFNAGTIAYSNSSAVISGYSSNTVGGLVGANSGGTIEHSYATGAVDGLNSSVAGGLVGQNEGGLIEYSYATGRAYGGYAGGLVGINEPGARNGTIEYSYAIGAAIGSSASGGLVGENRGPANPKVPAFGLIEDSYAIGFVNGGSSGGLVGINGGTISASFWVPQTTDQGNAIGSDTNNQSGNVAGLTPAQMTNSAYFTGWSFGGVGSGANWVIVDADGSINNASGAAGATLPMLLSEYSTTITNAHQLQLIALDPTANYTLAANVDASGTAGGDVWTSAGFIPLGSQGTAFTGVFNGTGHTISNLTIDLPAQTSVGLFGYSSGTIENVAMALGSITGAGAVGALAGTNAGTISESYSITPVTAVGANGGAGGLAGSNTGTITNSYTMIGAVVSAAGTGGYAGGLVANNAVSGQLTDSYAAGTVSAGGLAGGVIGINNGSSSAVYWDTETTGQRAGFGAQNGSGSAIGYTTAQMQSAVSFSPSVWGTGADLYPYLLWQYPFGTPQSVSGIAYSDFGITPLVGGQVSVVVVGTPEGSVSTAANGYYYVLLAPGTLSSSTVFTQGPLTYTGTSVLAYETSGGDGARADFMAQSTTGFDIANNMLLIPATATTYSTLIAEEFNLEQMALLQTEISPSAVSQAFGNTVDTLSLVETLSVIPNFGFITSGTFTFDEPATITSPLLIQTKTGDIDVEYPVTLTGTGALALNAAGNVNVDQAITLGGSGSLALVAGNNINFNANVLVQAGGALSFSTGVGSDYSLGAGDSIDFTAGDGSGATLTINGAPYTLVYSAADLENINNNTSGNYALADAVNASSVSTWMPIGQASEGPIATPGPGFSGVFAGLGNTISNVTVNMGSSGYFGGVFASSSGTIRDVNAVNVNVTGGVQTGGLIGRNLAAGVILDSTVSGSVSGTNSIGIFAGRNDGTISDSAAYVVSANGSGYGAGGFVGDNTATGSITNSNVSGNNAQGTLTAFGAVDSAGGGAGGFAGLNAGTLSGDGATQLAVGNGTSNTIGGFVGQNASGGNIQSSTVGDTSVAATSIAGGFVGSNVGSIEDATAAMVAQTGSSHAVSGTSYIGGFAGENTGTISGSTGTSTATIYGSGNRVGGFVGWNTGSLTSADSASDPVSGAAQVGGFAGWNDGTITNSNAWTVSTDGTGYGVGGFVGYNTATGSISQSSASGNNTNGTLTTFGSVNALGGGAGGFAGENAGSFGSDSATQIAIGSSSVSAIGGFIGQNAVGGTITNGAVTDSTVVGNTTVGGFAGTNSGSIGSSSVSLITVPGSYAVIGATYVGGFAGNNAAGATITGSSVAGAGSVDGTGNRTGGFVGWNAGSLTSGDSAAVAVFGTQQVGGLVGWNDGVIADASASGNATGTSGVGGLVGQNTAAATISQSFATGTVVGSGNVGGLVGDNLGGITNAYATGAVDAPTAFNVGGLVGLNSGTISDVYADGTVSGEGHVGALIGSNASGSSVTHAYIDAATTGTSPAAGVNAGTLQVVTIGGAGEPSLTLQATYVGFDFTNVWTIAPGDMPTLLHAP